MKLLLTGGSGHLGANLVRRLCADGNKVRVLLRPQSDNRAFDGLDVERVAGDLRDLEAVRAAVRGCERIFHCAAKVSTLEGSEREIYDCNVLGTRHVLQAARESGVSKVVVTGSFSAVGNIPGEPSDEKQAFYPFEHHMPYERSKAWVEHECLKAAVEGLHVVIAISCAILGPNDFKPSRMGRVLKDFSQRKMSAYIPGGFEFVAARDIVQGHLLAMEKGRSGQRYIFSTKFTTVDELIEIMARVTGQPKPRFRLPASVMAPIAHVSTFVLTNFFPQVPQRFTPGAVRILQMQRHADTTKARTELGFVPSSIEEAVRDAHAWFIERGEIPRPAGWQPTPAASHTTNGESPKIHGVA